jgi:hypothetical protein
MVFSALARSAASEEFMAGGPRAAAASAAVCVSFVAASWRAGLMAAREGADALARADAFCMGFLPGPLCAVATAADDPPAMVEVWAGAEL